MPLEVIRHTVPHGFAQNALRLGGPTRFEPGRLFWSDNSTTNYGHLLK
jgi:hypothetical protein